MLLNGKEGRERGSTKGHPKGSRGVVSETRKRTGQRRRVLLIGLVLSGEKREIQSREK